MVRSITIVISNNTTKVAQYCYGSGGPRDQGYAILEFLRNRNLKKFKLKVDALGIIDSADNKKCVGILDDIYDGKVLVVKLDTDFIQDDIFCDWGYIIDLTRGTFKITNGGDKTYRLDALPTLDEFTDEWW